MIDENLIRLGAMAQKRYDMADNFQILIGEVKYKRYAIPYQNGLGFSVETVDLEEVGIIVDGCAQTYWIGYSKRANKLIVWDK